MKHYGLEIPEGSSIKNLTAPSNSSFPSNAKPAEMFFRSDENGMYYYTGTEWTPVGGVGVDTRVVVDTFTGTGSPSNVDFTLTNAPANENELLVFVGGVYQEQSTYSVLGTTLSLTESPANGVGVEVTSLPTSISGHTLSSTSQIATGGSPAQTVFNVNYIVGNIFVYLNGAKLVNTTDYTATNGTSVVLAVGAAEGDVLSFEVFSPFATSSNGNGTNLIINGDMRVSQRGTSFAAIANGDFCTDRWKLGSVTTGVTTITQATTTVSDNQPFESHLEIDVTTVDASIAAGDVYAISTRIEGYDIAHLMYGKTSALNVTLRFRHAHTKTGTYCVSLKNSAGDRSYVVEYTQNNADTWETSTITIPGDMTGTWVIGDGTGLHVSFTCMAGTTFQTTAGSWQAGNYLATSSQVNGLDSTANFMRFSGIELVEGNNADNVKQRSYKDEFERCQRYFMRIEGLNIGFGFANTTTDFRGTVPTPTTMRADATVTVVVAFNSLRLRGGVADSITPTAIQGNGLQTNGMEVQVTVASGLNTNYTYILYAPNDGIDLDAEL